MSKPVFVEEDFEDLDAPIYKQIAVDRAQKKINKWLSEQKVMYLTLNADGLITASASVSYQGMTHTARLVCIEEIKKCEHSDYELVGDIAFPIIRCRTCFKHLKPIAWEEI